MPDRAAREEWIEQYGDPRDPQVDPIDWIERIPISETRNYVQRVIENMQVYRALIENNPQAVDRGRPAPRRVGRRRRGQSPATV